MTKTKLAAFLVMAMTTVAAAGNKTTTPVATTPAATTPTATAPAPAAGERVSDDCARARKQNKTCVLDMGNEQVGGDVVHPNGMGVAVVDWTKAGSLIRIRKDFINEIVKTAEDL